MTKSPRAITTAATTRESRIVTPAEVPVPPDTKKHAKPPLGCDLYTDGASRGNPGHSGIGGVLYSRANHSATGHLNPSGRKELATFAKYVGVRTNNGALRLQAICTAALSPALLPAHTRVTRG